MSEWRPIEAASPEIRKIAQNAPSPQVGAHIGKTCTLPDGRWLVLKFPPAEHELIPRQNLSLAL